MVSLNNTLAMLKIQGSLNKASSNLSSAYQRLSSGLRITRASDDAAGLAVASGLFADARIFSQGVLNVNDGVSYLNLMQGAMQELKMILQRQSELAVQASNEVFTDTQRAALDVEVQDLNQEYNRILQTTEFNQKNLFSSSETSLIIQAGYGQNGVLRTVLGRESTAADQVIGDGTFGEASFLSQGQAGSAVDLMDLNSDGIIDMVAVGGNSIVVSFGAGDGTFVSSLTYLASGILDVALGDLNDDGNIDIVTSGANGGLGFAAILLGQGGGLFSSSGSYAAEGSISYAVTLSDLNDDGVLDLITAGSDSGSSNGYTTVRLGVGNGTFGVATSYETHDMWGIAYDVALEDLNSDGVPDLVSAGHSASSSRGGATVRLGVGDGTFGEKVMYDAFFGQALGLTLADLDGDDVIDMITVGENLGVGSATVFMGVGDGTFTTGESYQTEPWLSTKITTGDLNGDGILDLVTTGYDGGQVGYTTVRFGVGDGTFGSATSYTASSGGSYDVALADLNQDGVLDVVTAGVEGVAGGPNVRLASMIPGETTVVTLEAQESISITSRALALAAQVTVNNYIDEVNVMMGVVAASISRFEVAMVNLQSAVENTRVAAGRIMDADTAEELAILLRSTVQQQTATAMFAQANLQPEMVLKLLDDS